MVRPIGAAASVSPFVVARVSEVPPTKPSWLAPRDERDVRLLRWSAAPETRPATPTSLRPRSVHPSVVVPVEVDVVEVRVPTPPAVPSFDGALIEREREELTAAFAEATTSMQAQIDAYRMELREACEREAVKLAFVVAARIVGAEIATRPEIALAWAREGTESLMGDGPVEIRVGSHLAALLREHGSEADVREDATLDANEVRVIGERGFVDAGLGTRLGAIFEDVAHREAT